MSDITRTLPIPFERLSSDDPRHPRGYRQIVQPGALGLKEVRETTTLEDGIEVDRRVASEQVLREPVAERVVVGSRDDPALDAFRESAWAIWGGAVSRGSAGSCRADRF